jgi:hypothetical protein
VNTKIVSIFEYPVRIAAPEIEEVRATAAQAGSPERGAKSFCGISSEPGCFDLLITDLANLPERAPDVCLEFLVHGVELDARDSHKGFGSQ